MSGPNVYSSWLPAMLPTRHGLIKAIVIPFGRDCCLLTWWIVLRTASPNNVPLAQYRFVGLRGEYVILYTGSVERIKERLDRWKLGGR